LQAIDREEDLPDRSVLSPQGLEVLLARGKHDLIRVRQPILAFGSGSGV